MRSSVNQRLTVSAACLGLLSACNSFNPALRETPLPPPPTAPLPSLAALRSSLGPTFDIVQEDIGRLKADSRGQALALEYLKTISANPRPKVISALHSILTSNSFLQASSPEKIKLLEILSSSVTEARSDRLRKCFDSPELSYVLDSRDFTGQKLWVSLHEIATKPLNQESNNERGAIVTALLEYISGIRPLDQGDTFECGPVSCLIALDNKAEIVRLVQGLCSPDGAVQLASGKIMKRCDSSLKDYGDYEQGPAIRVLAASVLDHANGGLLSYSYKFDMNNLGPVGFPGMLPSWCLRSMEDLTGKKHKMLKGEAASVSEMKEILKKCKYVIVFSTSSPLAWHWIVVRRIDNDWAYFQDPNGFGYTAAKEDSQKETHKKFSINLSPLMDNQSNKNFPYYTCSPTSEGMCKTPLSALERCTRAIIVPAYAAPQNPR